ncbi:MAG: hypothetical protein P4M11_12490 [Candidatus Pacebacteria bacterium]|nr:hypothetical protein [Candidatus Paceibacterota bacterium]
MANPKQLVSLRADVNSVVFDYLKDITPVVYYVSNGHDPAP